MTTATTTLTKAETLDYESTARAMRYDADLADALANDVEEWGNAGNRSPRAALGLIERGEQIADSGKRHLDRAVIGRNTRVSLRNDLGIALLDRGAMGYGLMHALAMEEQYGKGTPVGKTAVKASNLRVYASLLRMVAQMCDKVVAGEYRKIG